MPPKKEYIIYALLSVKQRDLYDKIVEGWIHQFLIEKGITDSAAGKEDVVDVNAPRWLRGGKKRRYDVDESKDEYFEQIEQGEVEDGAKKRRMWQRLEDSTRCRKMVCRLVCSTGGC